MSTPCKIVLKKDNRKYITYYSSDGYPNEILPMLINLNELEPDEYPVYDEHNDPYFDFDFLYVIEDDKIKVFNPNVADAIYDRSTGGLIELIPYDDDDEYVESIYPKKV